MSLKHLDIEFSSIRGKDYISYKLFLFPWTDFILQIYTCQSIKYQDRIHWLKKKTEKLQVPLYKCHIGFWKFRFIQSFNVHVVCICSNQLFEQELVIKHIYWMFRMEYNFFFRFQKSNITQDVSGWKELQWHKGMSSTKSTHTF